MSELRNSIATNEKLVSRFSTPYKHTPGAGGVVFKTPVKAGPASTLVKCVQRTPATPNKMTCGSVTLASIGPPSECTTISSSGRCISVLVDIQTKNVEQNSAAVFAAHSSIISSDETRHQQNELLDKRRLAREAQRKRISEKNQHKNVAPKPGSISVGKMAGGRRMSLREVVNGCRPSTYQRQQVGKCFLQKS